MLFVIGSVFRYRSASANFVHSFLFVLVLDMLVSSPSQKEQQQNPQNSNCFGLGWVADYIFIALGIWKLLISIVINFGIVGCSVWLLNWRVV